MDEADVKEADLQDIVMTSRKEFEAQVLIFVNFLDGVF